MQEAFRKGLKKESVSLLVIGVNSPLKVGIYKESNLIESFSLEGKSSDVLPQILSKLLGKYSFESIYYANGPGSFMSIKVAYVALKTLSIVLNIPLFASDAFAFNGNRPIKAVGKSYFIKEGEEIKIAAGVCSKDTEFMVPKRLDKSIFCSNNKPLYILPAV